MLWILTNLNLPPIQYIRKLTHLQMLTSQMEGDDSKPADDDDREGVAEGQRGQGLLQHGLQINVVPELGIFVFLTGFRSHDINIIIHLQRSIS